MLTTETEVFAVLRPPERVTKSGIEE